MLVRLCQAAIETHRKYYVWLVGWLVGLIHKADRLFYSKPGPERTLWTLDYIRTSARAPDHLDNALRVVDPSVPSYRCCICRFRVLFWPSFLFV